MLSDLATTPPISYRLIQQGIEKHLRIESTENTMDGFRQFLESQLHRDEHEAGFNRPATNAASHVSVRGA
jgi:hypothetical protein